MENLSIDQLADLKIAIRKTDTELKEKQELNTALASENARYVADNRRLQEEIDMQAQRIEDHKAENVKLIEEKQGILSKFAQDNEANYKDSKSFGLNSKSELPSDSNFYSFKQAYEYLEVNKTNPVTETELNNKTKNDFIFAETEYRRAEFDKKEADKKLEIAKNNLEDAQENNGDISGTKAIYDAAVIDSNSKNEIYFENNESLLASDMISNLPHTFYKKKSKRTKPISSPRMPPHC